MTGIGSVLNDNPKLVEGLAIGAMAFSAMQTAVTGATQVFDLMNTVLKTNPIMLIAMGVALAAGLIIANWTPISAFFTHLWDGVKNVATKAMAVLEHGIQLRTPLGDGDCQLGADFRVLLPYLGRHQSHDHVGGGLPQNGFFLDTLRG